MLRSPIQRILRGPIDDVAVARMWRGIRQGRAAASRVRRRIVAVAALVFLTAAAFVVAQQIRPHNVPQVSAVLSLADGSPLRPAAFESARSEAAWSLSDGSRLSFAPGTRWEPLANSPAELVSSVRAGATTFDVKPGGPRRWVIEAGPVSVEVVGTRFVVARDAERVRVAVERGAVLVRGEAVPDKVQRLVAGQQLVVPLVQSAPATPPSASEAATEHGAPTAPPTWFERARAGKFAEVYDALGTRGIELEAERTRSIERLLSLSDVARRSGHPEAAVVPLQRILDEHPARPEAGLSAVTLGRLFLDQLDQPRAAARAFERALGVAGARGLRQDTYLRLIEAYERCGDQTAADGAMQRYEQEFHVGGKGQ